MDSTATVQLVRTSKVCVSVGNFKSYMIPTSGDFIKYLYDWHGDGSRWRDLRRWMCQYRGEDELPLDFAVRAGAVDTDGYLYFQIDMLWSAGYTEVYNLPGFMNTATVVLMDWMMQYLSFRFCHTNIGWYITDVVDCQELTDAIGEDPLQTRVGPPSPPPPRAPIPAPSPPTPLEPAPIPPPSPPSPIRRSQSLPLYTLP